MPKNEPGTAAVTFDVDPFWTNLGAEIGGREALVSSLANTFGTDQLRAAQSATQHRIDVIGKLGTNLAVSYLAGQHRTLSSFADALQRRTEQEEHS